MGDGRWEMGDGRWEMGSSCSAASTELVPNQDITGQPPHRDSFQGGNTRADPQQENQDAGTVGHGREAARRCEVSVARQAASTRGIKAQIISRDFLKGELFLNATSARGPVDLVQAERPPRLVLHTWDERSQNGGGFIRSDLPVSHGGMIHA